MWPIASRREPLSLSCPPGDAQASAFMCCLVPEYVMWWLEQLHGPWPHWLYMQALWGSLKWTAAGNKLSYLDGCLAARVGFKGLYFKMEQKLWAQAFVLVLLRMVGLCLGIEEEMGFQMGSRHSPRSCSIWIKPFSFFGSNCPMSLAFMAAGRWTSLFCLVIVC